MAAAGARHRHRVLHTAILSMAAFKVILTGARRVVGGVRVVTSGSTSEKEVIWCYCVATQVVQYPITDGKQDE